MDGVIEDPGMVADEDSENNNVAARVPSFYIGKPLVDFDAGIGRVCSTFYRPVTNLQQERLKLLF